MDTTAAPLAVVLIIIFISTIISFIFSGIILGTASSPLAMSSSAPS